MTSKKCFSVAVGGSVWSGADREVNMGYRVIFNFDDGTTDEDLLDEVFDTEEEAEVAAEQCASDFSQGRGYLEEAGEDFCEECIEDWDIVEV